ncbi:hypothetical protein PVAP13_2NG393603 [Panicum virgatum]|uniref:Uncharacterized protein n=1 Tax=Panicum virgatum TaxID=38727 RepID=A0A8T0VJ89_PANVG|nr:hypothetical protein PVAP13_2NG393603 [Panicum virgatum]
MVQKIQMSNRVLIEDGSSVGSKMQRVNRHWSARQYGAFAVHFQIPSQTTKSKRSPSAQCAHTHVVGGGNVTPRTHPHVGSPNIPADPLAGRRTPHAPAAESMEPFACGVHPGRAAHRRSLHASPARRSAPPPRGGAA